MISRLTEVRHRAREKEEWAVDVVLHIVPGKLRFKIGTLPGDVRLHIPG